MSITGNTWPYIAWVTPMSRTLTALPANIADSSRGRPNSLTSMAPATLNRSVIIEPISALSCMDSRVSRCILRPTSRDGRMKKGIRIKVMTLTSQDR